jgi:hypothetical protein
MVIATDLVNQTFAQVRLVYEIRLQPKNSVKIRNFKLASHTGHSLTDVICRAASRTVGRSIYARAHGAFPIAVPPSEVHDALITTMLASNVMVGSVRHAENNRGVG